MNQKLFDKLFHEYNLRVDQKTTFYDVSDIANTQDVMIYQPPPPFHQTHGMHVPSKPPQLPLWIEFRLNEQWQLAAHFQPHNVFTELVLFACHTMPHPIDAWFEIMYCSQFSTTIHWNADGVLDLNKTDIQPIITNLNNTKHHQFLPMDEQLWMHTFQQVLNACVKLHIMHIGLDETDA